MFVQLMPFLQALYCGKRAGRGKLRLRKGKTDLGLLTRRLFAIVTTLAWAVINKPTIDLVPLEKNSWLACSADKLAAACSRVPAAHLALGFGTDPSGAVLTHPVTTVCPPHHQNPHISDGFCPAPRRWTISASPSNDALSSLSLAGNLISPVNDTQGYFGAGLRGESKARQQFDWRRTTQRRGGEVGRHSLTPSSKASAGGLGGTFCCASLPSLGFLFYFPEGKRDGGSTTAMVSPCPLFPFSPFPLLSSQ